MDEKDKDRLREPRRPYEFTDPMTPRERRLALGYLAFHAIIIPLGLNALSLLWPGQAFDSVTINLVYYGLGFAFSLFVLGGYLRRAYDTLIDNWRGVLFAFASAYLLDILLSWALTMILIWLGDPLTSSPNDEYVAMIAEKNWGAMFAMAVFMAPIVEEPLFRGAVFGSLRGRSRALAYAASIITFSLYHVWQYAASSGDLSYLLYAFVYVPVSAALCFCYERSGSIWTPIFFHIVVNLLTMTFNS